MSENNIYVGHIRGIKRPNFNGRKTVSNSYLIEKKIKENGLKFFVSVSYGTKRLNQILENPCTSNTLTTLISQLKKMTSIFQSFPSSVEHFLLL
jgi:hypothetical protein